MRIAKFSIAAATFLIAAGPAFAIESSVTMTSSMSPDAAWKKVGAFCGIANWLSAAVEKCVLSADGNQRTLSLKGGGTVVEEQVSRDDANRTYTYKIISGPLPVANYQSTISVSADPKGSSIKWAGKYDAKDASDDEAKKVMDGLYEAGVKSLAGG